MIGILFPESAAGSMSMAKGLSRTAGEALYKSAAPSKAACSPNRRLSIFSHKVQENGTSSIS